MQKVTEKINTTASQDVSDFLLSDKYRHLLRRAIYARIGTTSSHFDEHRRALDLLDTAFPNDFLVFRRSAETHG